MGRQVSPTKAVADSYNALGNNTNFTPGDVGAITGFDNRISNAITYLTPTVNGLSGQIMFSDSNTTTTTEDSTVLLNGSAGADGAATGVTAGTDPGTTTNAGYRVTKQGEVKAAGINYAVGKFAFAYAMQDQTAMTAGVASTNDITIAAATYDFGFLKAHLDQTTRKSESGGTTKADRKVTTLGVTVPVNAKLSLVAQYFDGERKASSGTNTFITTAETTAADYKGYKARATYALSKRTGLYGQVGQTETKVQTTGATTTVEGYGLGLYHTF
jgi:predicted porin